MSSGLGLIVSGRLVQTDWTPVSDTQYVTVISDADSINHVVVFLTGTVALPPNMVGMVYFSWPDPTAPPNWQLLGHISNSKPSAIFKVASLKKLNEMESETSFSGAFGSRQICHDAQLGVAIEPEINATIHQTSLVTAQTTFAQKMLENLFNFVSSFAVTPQQMALCPPTATFVPLDRLQAWYTNFQRRLQTNPNFWKN